MPAPGPYGNKRPAIKARQERRKRIATKVARKTAKFQPNEFGANDKMQFRDTYRDIMRYNLDSPAKYKRFGARLKAAKNILAMYERKAGRK